jgi:hypothetical protein
MSFKNYFIFCFFLLSTTLHAQLEYGVKVGAILNASGSITNAPSDFSSIESAKESLSGYYLGGFIEIDLPLIYLRPELQFSSLNTDVENLSLSQTRIEAPISIGLNVLPLISVFAGPSLRYESKPKIENISLSELESATSVGVHFGTRLHLGPLSIGIRYDRGLKANETSLLENKGIPISGNIDTRVNQWSLGLAYKLN